MVVVSEPGSYYVIGWYSSKFGGNTPAKSLPSLQWHKEGEDIYTSSFADGHADMVEMELDEVSTLDYTFDITR